MPPSPLLRRTLLRFALCVAALLVLATPLFWWLTKTFYAEDVIDVIEAARRGEAVPSLDLETDIMQGVMIQFGLILVVIGVAAVVMLRFISQRLWAPFDRTLQAVEAFRIEEGNVPKLEASTTEEFDRMNRVLTHMMTASVSSYRTQREFTENASHELQTPLAVIQSELELLMQQPGLTEAQAAVIRDLFDTLGRLSRLNRNLLLLAKLENNQYRRDEAVDLVQLVDDLVPRLEVLANGAPVVVERQVASIPLKANRPLLESMAANLIVNALRHNAPGGTVHITLAPGRFVVTNCAADGPLDASRIWERFYRPAGQSKGNGLGLAIVRSVATYHGWRVAYSYRDGQHVFEVRMAFPEVKKLGS